MKYGCIGEHLKHSFSAEIHAQISDYSYEIREIPREDLSSFMEASDFLGINVTIPYKELVIPHLYYIHPDAERIGAVNTIVKREGKLYGYNTDFYGMTSLIKHAGASLEGKKVAILGTGGTAKTAHAVSESLGAREIHLVSRNAREGAIDYTSLYEDHSDTEVIINTTPVGMFPNIYDAPIDISRFPSLLAVIDAIYNPLSTPLISAARKRGITAEGGLYMLVAQAVRASEIFFDTTYDEGLLDKVYTKIYKSKKNAVLIGMPASGKSTVGRTLADALGRSFIDTDEVVTRIAGMPIPELIAKFGEGHFRDIEAQAVREVATTSCAVIATGGGAILRRENVDMLKENGDLYFLDRPLDLLIPTEDRPLSSTKEAIAERYRERYPIYTSVCDRIIDASGDVADVTEKILEDFR